MSSAKCVGMRKQTPDITSLTDAQIRKFIQNGQATAILEEIKSKGFADPKLNEQAKHVDINTLVKQMSSAEIFKIIRDSISDPGFELKLQEERNKKGVTMRKCKECGDKFPQTDLITSSCPACVEVKMIESGQSSLSAQVNVNKCRVCNNNGTKNCARCKKVKYCSRECQVKDWPNHKPNCK